MIFLTSDQHFYHERIIRYESRKFKDTTEMNNEIIKRHNSVVTKADTVFHLGDFAFARNWKDARALLDRMNGTHHLISGNHDKLYIWDYIEAGFESVHTSLVLMGQSRYVLVHDPAIAGVNTQAKFIHGHTHSLGKKLNTNSYCVCVELHDYYPVSLSTIEGEFK